MSNTSIGFGARFEMPGKHVRERLSSYLYGLRRAACQLPRASLQKK